MLNHDPKTPYAHVSVETLSEWLQLLAQAPGDALDHVERSLRRTREQALRSHNPPTGELVVEGNVVLQVLSRCTCSPHNGHHQPECALDYFGPAEDFVKALRKGGYIVIPPEEIEEAFNQAPADVDACICDPNPSTTDGPSIECPQHGEGEQQRQAREEREFRQLREGNWTPPEGPEPYERVLDDLTERSGVPLNHAATMRRIGHAMKHPISQTVRFEPEPVARERERLAESTTFHDEVGDRQARLREHAQRLNRVGHDLRSPELLAASRDLIAELGPGWAEVPTMKALSGSLPSPGSGDTGEPPLGATLDSQDVEPQPKWGAVVPDDVDIRRVKSMGVCPEHPDKTIQRLTKLRVKRVCVAEGCTWGAEVRR